MPETPMATDNIMLTVTEDEPDRIDKYITAHLNDRLTRSAIARLIEQGNVVLNGKNAQKSDMVYCGDTIGILLPRPIPDKATPEDIPLDIVYEDYDLLVVNKPKGMVVHPAPGNYHGTLVNALLYHCGDSLSG
ncbi:MAG: RNA pseudouridine synthase, partial [Acutalibacteraceae bacterium]|nr:RNA pseudouridine synthase [Acutalibacteraceae bacterium]